MERRHLPVLDGIRGLAIIAVLLRHSAYVFRQHDSVTRWFLPVMQSGAWGVDLFFVLSGFLITGILLDTKSALNRASSFYGRRILRIFPIYYLIIGLVLAGDRYQGWVRDAAHLQNLPDHIAYLLYFQNLIPLWHHGQFPESIIGPFWSLAVEEQFYFLWPVIVWHFAPKTIGKICAWALAGALLLRLILVPVFGDGIWVYAFTLTRADGLFVGSALAVIFSLKGRFSNRLLAGMAGAGVAALAAIALLGPVNQLWLTGPYMSTIGISAVALLCGALVGFCLQFSLTPLAKLFKEGWIRRFGKYSYGMYVYHLPIYYAVQHILMTRFGVGYPLKTGYAIPYVALLMAATFGFAWLSFTFYEQAFLRLKVHFEPVFDRKPVAPTVAVVLVPQMKA